MMNMRENFSKPFKPLTNSSFIVTLDKVLVINPLFRIPLKPASVFYMEKIQNLLGLAISA